MEDDMDDNKKTLNVEATIVDLENAEEPVNNDAKIYSPEVSDILPIFVNMLDAKSFMKLAMTCKGMYTRYMEDQMIKIKVDENHVGVYSDEGGVGFYIQSSFVSEKNIRSYVATLRKQRFCLNVSEVRIDGTPTDIPIVNAARIYLKDIGVNNIEKLLIFRGLSDWEAIIPFIKEFRVRIVDIYGPPVPHPVLRSLLQLDLDQFEYDGPIPVDLFLEVDSPIRKIDLPGMQNIEWDKFLQILSKIHSRNILHLTLNRGAVTWAVDETFKLDEEDELPEHRPLVFKSSPNLYEEGTVEYFFLHWHGGVTKCAISYFDADMEIFKCAPNEYPPILRKDEDVQKDLTEMVPRVFCYSRQFDAFVEKFTLIEPSYEGHLPPERPLYFKVPNGLCKLTEDDELMECTWIDTQATWKPFQYFPRPHFGYRVLAKLLFSKHILEPDKYCGGFDCEGLEELEFWLEDYRKLDFDCSVPLPKERPLVFEKPQSGDKKSFVIFFDVHLLHCEFSNNKVEIRRCEPSERPPILIDDKTVKEILQEGISNQRGGLLSSIFPSGKPEKQGDVRIRVDHETFLNGFELFKTSPSKRCKHLPLVFEKTQNIDGKLIEERWFDNCHGLSKTVWQDGYASLSEDDGHEIPFESMKELFKECVQVHPMREFRLCEWLSDIFPEDSYIGLPMDLKQFEHCLELFETHLFDYCGPLPKDRPLAFVKKETRHVCDDAQGSRANCGCAVVTYRVWLLSDGVTVSYCTWEATSQRVEFTECGKDLPPILKSKLYIKNLLQKSEVQDERWYGSLADFVAFFDDYMKISLSHEGPIPVERPLVVEQDTVENHSLLIGQETENHTRYLLRDDGRIIKCQWNDEISGAIIQTIRPFADKIPTVLMSEWQ